MKVHFISNKYDGCQVVRCLHPIIYNGWDGDKTSLCSERISANASLELAKRADVVVFHRPDDESRLKSAIILKKLGKMIVFDNDDTYKDNDNMKLGKYLEAKNTVLDRFIKLADLVTTTTEFLADEYRQINKNVEVLPNCIDPNDWSEPLKNKTNKVRVGIFGSTTLNGDSYHIKNVLKNLSDREDVQLVMFGLPPKELQTNLVKDLYKRELAFWGSLNIEWQHFVPMEDYYDTLNSLRLDLTLIPRKDTYFNRCKSNLKFLEASMLEIPVIAQAFADGKSPYQGKDEPYMVVTNNWQEEVNKLIADKKLRQSMGKKAKEYVLKEYNIINNAKNWRNTYIKYANKK